MRLRMVTWLAAALLLGGGVAFAVLGFRALRLERERSADELTRRVLAWAVADAERLARLPTGAPLEWWRIEPLTVPGAAEVLEDEDVELLHETWQKVEACTLEEAYAIWDGVAREGRARWLRQTAALHAGMLAARLEQQEEAERHLKVAAGAHELLVSPKSGRVRAWALEQLAELGLRAGRSGPTREFLEAVEHGRRLADQAFGGGGPDTWLVALQEQVAEGVLPAPEPATAERLAAAARHATNGMYHLLALGAAEEMVRLADDRIVLRTGDRLQTRPLTSLVEPPPAGVASRVEVLPVDPDAALGPHMARLAPPLEGVVVRVTPESRAASGAAALLALVAGLTLYAVGALLAIGALRRSRRAAQMQTDFVATVSHELKTPIASVRAMAELLADAETPDPERTRRYATRIEGEMRRLGDTVRNVLDAARIERLGALPVSLRPADPAPVVASAVNAVRPDLERRGFHLTCEARPAASSLAIDPEALRGVLLNLLDNAAKYSGERRDVRVEAGPLRDGNGYGIAVLDRGRGLESGKHEGLFRRFQRGVDARRDAVPGVGLGLHVARSVVEAHGGRLWAEARDGGGAVFRIELRGTES